MKTGSEILKIYNNQPLGVMDGFVTLEEMIDESLIEAQTPKAVLPNQVDLLCGDLVVVSQWRDFDYPQDAVSLGILTKIDGPYHYIDDNIRGFKHCKFVSRKIKQ